MRPASLSANATRPSLPFQCSDCTFSNFVPPPFPPSLTQTQKWSANFPSISTLCAALLDIYVFRRSNMRGTYNQMHDLPEIDQKARLPSPRRFQENNEPYDSSAIGPRSPLEEAYDPPNDPANDGTRSPYDDPQSAPYDPPKLSRESSRSAPFEMARVSHDTPKPSAEVSRPIMDSKMSYSPLDKKHD